jgi:PTS system nitrogen regulatory IIA component
LALDELLSADGVLIDLRANNKKQLLQVLSQRAATLTGYDESRILETILERERLGSTGFGNGIAIPHGRLAGLRGTTGVFARLEVPVDFDSLDRQPVDLVFMLLAPHGGGAEHLKALARISRTFRDQKLVEKLRGSTSADAIYALLTSSTRTRAA